MKLKNKSFISSVIIYFLFVSFLFLEPSLAETVYKNPKDFLNEVFFGDPPKAKTLAFFGKRKKKISDILSHPPRSIRARYWKKNTLTAFILEEIGKTKPITVGLVVENKQIQKVEVLIYRESHGSEVRHSYFTKQFNGAELEKKHLLSKKIDGISGATLSVYALKRLATLALFLEEEIEN